MGVKVILIMDTQHNSINIIKRFILFNLFRIFRYLLYTHAWVPGLPQYYLAAKLGFRPSCILTNLLSADNGVFNISLFPEINSHENNPIRFIYVGRLVEDKGLERFVSQWRIYSEKFPNSTLIVVGVGPLDVIFQDTPKVYLTGYLSPPDVAREMSKADCFILPSLYEPWGVVVHEAACMGLPLICSEQCGASSEFLIDDFNGYKFSWADRNSLATALIKFSILEYDVRKEFGRRSLVLAGRVTPIIAASKFNEWIKNF
jgi:glycosyltransferase involved in cell wall biosynthesis